ncbi:MAG: hypothetical protein ACRC3B_06430 [Bacteroidia bacterium]
MTNVLGEVVYNKQEQGWLKGTQQISLKGYAAGAYMVRIITAQGVQTIPVQVL